MFPLVPSDFWATPYNTLQNVTKIYAGKRPV